jgi:uncharacterized protein YacL (UPF0231 family)
MKADMTVTFRGLAPRKWIEEEIRKHAAKLDKYFRHIESCRAVVSVPHQHHQEGNRFSVRLEILVPDEEIVVSRESNLHASVQDLAESEWVKAFDVEGMRKDLKLVIREAFDAARRQLQDYARRNRMAVKQHAGAPVRRARRM